MKRIICFSIIIALLCIPHVYAKGVSIESIEIDSKSDNTEVVEDATIEDLKIKLNVNFVEKDDFIKYKIMINNTTDKDYLIEEKENDNDYIEYLYEFDDENKMIEKNKKSTLYMTIQYRNEVPIDALRTEGSIVQQNVLSIELDNKDEGNNNVSSIVDNPKTKKSILSLILLSFILLITIILVKKKRKLAVFILFLIPISVYAIEKFEISFDTTITISKKPVCIRATVLKTEYCSNGASNTNGYYCGSQGIYGQQMTYGNLGTEGVLEVGDAFDCDVNNDGVYDANQERFYYLSPEDADRSSNNITLIYYNSVNEGVPNSVVCNKYGSGMQGPDEGYKHLPTTEQWSNPLLYTNFDRQLKTNNNTTYIYYDRENYPLGRFVYTNRAARFVAHSEIQYQCLEGDLKRIKTNCSFLYENTIHSYSSRARAYWTESYSYYSIYNAEIIRGDKRVTDTQSTTETFMSVRPVIIVSKNNVQY